MKRIWPVVTLMGLMVFHVAMNIWWLRTDNHAPTGDEQTHYRLAFEYYLAFDDIAHGGVNSIGDAVERILEVDTRIYPPLQHVIGGFAAFLHGAYDHDAINLVHTIEFALLIALMFLTARIFMTPWQSFWVAFVASMFPGLYGTSRLYTQEMESILLVVAAMYGLFKTDYFRKLSWVIVFAFFAGLGFLSRWTTPMYIVPASALYLAISLVIAWRTNEGSSRWPAVGRVAVCGAVGVIVTIGVFAPWYVDHFASLRGGFEDYYQPRIDVAPPVPVDQHERWTRYAAFIIHTGIFLPTFLISLTGLLIATFGGFRKPPYLIVSAWFVGGYLVMSLVLWEFKHPAPRYALQMLPPLAFCAVIAINTIRPRKLRNAAVGLFAALLLLQYAGLTVKSYGRFGHIDLPLYTWKGYKFVGEEPISEGALLYSDKVMLAAGAFFSASDDGINWHDRISQSILANEAEATWTPNRASIPWLRTRKHPLNDLRQQMWPRRNPLSGSDLRSSEYVPEMIPCISPDDPNVSAVLVTSDKSRNIPVHVLRNRGSLLEITSPASLDIQFKSPVQIDAVLIELSAASRTNSIYSLQYRVPGSPEFRRIQGAGTAPGTASRLHRLAISKCAGLRIEFEENPGTTNKLSAVLPLTFLPQPRPIFEGPRLDAIGGEGALADAAYLVAEGEISRREQELLERHFKLLDRFSANIQTHWWPATFSVYARRDAELISFARNPGFTVRVSSDLRDVDPLSRWDVPWWAFGAPPDGGPIVETRPVEDDDPNAPPAYWGMRLPATASVDLGEVYSINKIDVALKAGLNGIEQSLVEYLDPETHTWHPVPDSLLDATDGESLPDSSPVSARQLRFLFRDDPDTHDEYELGYVSRIGLYGRPAPGNKIRPRPNFAEDGGTSLMTMLRSDGRPAGENMDDEFVYTMSLNDTIADVASRYRVSPAQIFAWNELDMSSRIGAGTRLRVHEPSGDWALPDFIARVTPGDSVRSMAEWCGESEANLRAWNHIEGDDMPLPGRLLFLAEPPQDQVPKKPARVTLSSDDSIQSLARREGISVQQLMYWNAIHPGEHLAPGTTLLVSPPTSPPPRAAGLHPWSEHDTWASVAREYGVSMQQLVAWNGPANPKPNAVLFIDSPRVDEDPPPTALHPLRAGETLADIAVAYRTTVAELVRLNSLEIDEILEAGDFLFVRADREIINVLENAGFANSYTTRLIQPEDTLADIARAVDTSAANLLEWNGLSNGAMIRAGTLLYVVPPPTFEYPGRFDIHVVGEGETIDSIAHDFALTPVELIEWNTLGGTAGFFDGASLFTGPIGTKFADIVVNKVNNSRAEWARNNAPRYIRGRGESLEKASDELGIPVRDLTAWNAQHAGHDPRTLSVNPPAKKADRNPLTAIATNSSLYGILDEFDIHLADFLAWNSLDNLPALGLHASYFIAPSPEWTRVLPSGMMRIRDNRDLAFIAERAGLELQSLKLWNSIENVSTENREYLFDAPPSFPVKPAAPMYRFTPGDTIASVASACAATVESLSRWNGLDAESQLREGDLLYVAEPAVARNDVSDSTGTHLAWGETIYDVSRRTGFRIQDIAAWNSIENPVTVAPGQYLRLTPPAEEPALQSGLYRLQPEDNILSLAVKNEVTVTQVIQWNALEANATLGIGSHLFITPPPAPPGSNAAPRRMLHWGETLHDVARREGVTVSQLEHWNLLDGNDVCFEGQMVFVADPYDGLPIAPELKVYDGEKGESVANIAVNHGVSLKHLRQWNPDLDANGNYLASDSRLLLSDPEARFISAEVMPDNKVRNEMSTEFAALPVTTGHTVRFDVLERAIGTSGLTTGIQRGDTLQRIARRTGNSVVDILASNPAMVARQYFPGDMLQTASSPLPGVAPASIKEWHATARFTRTIVLPDTALRGGAIKFQARGDGEGLVQFATAESSTYIHLAALTPSRYPFRSEDPGSSLPVLTAVPEPGETELSAGFALTLPSSGTHAPEMTIELKTLSPDTEFEVEGIPQLSFPPLVHDLALPLRGIHIALIDPMDGKVVDTARFDPYADREADRAVDYILSAPRGTMLAAVAAGDAMFRGRNLALALEEHYGIHVGWREDWGIPHASPLFRSGMIMVGIRGMGNGGYFAYDGFEALTRLVRRGDTLGNSPFRYPLDLYLHSEGARAGSGANIKVSHEALRYRKIDPALLETEHHDVGGDHRLTVHWPEGHAVDKIRVIANPDQNAIIEYTMDLRDVDARTLQEISAHKFAGPADAVRFHELPANSARSLTIIATLPPAMHTGLSSADIQLFSRIAPNDGASSRP